MNKHLETARSLAKLLDSQFSVLGFKFGLDPLIGLFPWLGDAVSAALAVYIIWIGKTLGIAEEKLTEMIRNVILDFLIGLVPVAGTIGDFFFKSNLKNLEILEKHIGKVVEGETTG